MGLANCRWRNGARLCLDMDWRQIRWRLPEEEEIGPTEPEMTVETCGKKSEGTVAEPKFDKMPVSQFPHTCSLWLVRSSPFYAYFAWFAVNRPFRPQLFLGDLCVLSRPSCLA